jgi:hypothetical protein
MKKQLLIAGGALSAAVIATGCAGVGTANGWVAPISAGPNFYSDVQASAVIQQDTTNYTIVKKNVTAQATLQSYFTCVNIGDISFATLKAAALKQAPGATDLVDVKLDYDMKNVCGINTITVKMTANAVKY